MSRQFWEQFYDRPLEKIPWQQTQADWFEESVRAGELYGESVLDIGCGTGKKSIYLLQNTGFEKAVGVDISKRAIEIASENATEAGVQDACEFIQADVTEWNFVDADQQFDLVLDWALLHGIPKEKRGQYIQGINQHTHKGSRLLLRVFSTEENKKYFTEEIDGNQEKIYFFDKEEVEDLFDAFEIVKENTSEPRTKDFQFLEMLIEKK